MSSSVRIFNSKMADGLALALVVVLAVAAFSPVLANGFVNWDDPAYLLRNPLFLETFPRILVGAWSSFPLGNYHPMTTLAQAAEYALFGQYPFPYHLVSLAIHIVNGMLTFSLLRRLGASTGAAITATILFVAHPMRVEAIAWVSAQKDLFCVAWTLTALHAYCVYADPENPSRKFGYAVSLGAFLLALLSKGTALVVPAFLVILDRAVLCKRGQGTGWKAKLPYFALAGIFGCIALVARSSFQDVLEEGAAGRIETFWLAVYRLGAYGLRTLVPWPGRFPAYPPAGGPTLWQFVTLGVLVALVLTGWRLKRQWSVEFAGVMIFIAGLLPALPLENVGYAADRFTYLAAVGLSLTAAALADRVRKQRPMLFRPLMGAVAVGCVFALLPLCRSMSAAWRDSDRLISSYVELYRQSPGRNLYLALALETRGAGRRLRGEETLALADFAAANQAWPEWVPSMIRGGESLLGEGRLAEAEAVFDRAASLSPANPRIFSDRAMVRLHLGHLQGALADAEKSVQLAVEDPAAYNSRGAVYQALNRHDDALADFTRAIKLTPSSLIPYVNRAMLYAEIGDWSQAEADLKAALHIDPNSPMVRECFARLAEMSATAPAAP